MLLEMQAEGQQVPALASRPTLDVSLALHYNDYKDVRCSRVPTFSGYGKTPYSELLFYCLAHGYRGEELLAEVKLLQHIDTVYNSVESKHLASKQPTDKTVPVQPPKAKEVAAAKEAKKVRMRQPQSNLNK